MLFSEQFEIEDSGKYIGVSLPDLSGQLAGKGGMMMLDQMFRRSYVADEEKDPLMGLITTEINGKDYNQASSIP